MEMNKQLAESWSKAAKDLGFRFVSPFEIEQVSFTGLVEGFGSSKGTLIFVNSDEGTSPWASIATKNGYGYSCLSSHYEEYDRESFIDTLNDWGWSKPDQNPPTWYTGQPWTE